MIALRRSKVQTQLGVLTGKSPAIQLNVNATRMSQAFAGSSYIQQMVLGEVNEFVQRSLLDRDGLRSQDTERGCLVESIPYG